MVDNVIKKKKKKKKKKKESLQTVHSPEISNHGQRFQFIYFILEWFYDCLKDNENILLQNNF